MNYECPFCSSKKKPKIVGYFTPEIVKCLDCNKMHYEREFLKKDKNINILTQ
ncbi:MAG: hypothetical protein ACFFAN_18760 [Promethearchaeota archaeon]